MARPTAEGGSAPLHWHVHRCLVYDDHTTYLAEAVAFLADGVRRGCRVCYIGELTEAALRMDLRALPSVDDLLRTRQLIIVSVADTDQSRVSTWTPDVQVDAYLLATRQALTTGFTGLRVAANVSPVVRGDAAPPALLRYEHQIDRVMARGVPLSALCGYDRSRIGDAAAATFATVHPESSGVDVAFHVHGAGPDVLALAGEIDAWATGELATVLRPILSNEATPAVTIDCAGLRFIDHRALLELDMLARMANRVITLVRPTAAVIRAAELVPLPSLRIAA